MIVKEVVKRVYLKIPYEWRAPALYKKFLAIESQKPHSLSVKEWQMDKFREIALHAYNTVPGYHQLYTEAGVKETDILHLENVEIIPFTTKELIRDNIKDFVSTVVPANQKKMVMTSGSSGHPFQFYQRKEEDWIENAFVTKAWTEGGWNIGQSGILLRGAYTGSEDAITAKCANNDFYVHNNSILCSPNYITPQYYIHYRKALTDTEQSYIFAFPSSITLLSELIINEGDAGEFNNIRALYLSSENLYDWQLDSITKAFPSAVVISLYGLSERVIMASWKRDSRLYYTNPYYGLTELLGDGQKPVRTGEKGELVGTSFWSMATPFIRYKTYDYAVRGEDNGDGMVLEKIEGRLQEVVVGANGRQVSMTAVANIHDSSYDGIRRFRFIQNEPGKVNFQIEPNSSFTPGQCEQVKKSLLAKLGDDFDVEVLVVEELKPSKSGKFSYLEQHLKIQNVDRLQY